ncbi:MAG TPA: arginase family protein [Gemmatimonadaceae bacterium]|jgi:arginase|nr:arginase family protein [Gemmatimonadaceae bacterium]
MKKITLITVPYDSGHRGLRMGRGPLHLSEHGAAGRLRAAGHDVVETAVEVPASFPTEVGTSFALHRALSDSVRTAVAGGAFPLVLAGNCGSALGTVSGVRAGTPNDSSDVGVVWLDAHADFNTPETTTSGFLDGQMLSALTGGCWHALASSIPGFRPVRDAHAVLVGARDLDAAEVTALAASGVTWVRSADVRAAGVQAALDAALATLAQRVSRVYLHIDLDVHDPAEAQANQYAAPDGLSAAAVREVVSLVARHVPIVAAALTAYDPTYDPESRMLEAGLRLIDHIARH